jgi:putative N-acetylmannosamine-6-phosphate 2-epimerase 1
MDNNKILESIKGKLIVSCQALENEPLYTEEGNIMPLMAKAAIQSGAGGIRANGVRDIQQIKKVVDVPIIGIIKKNYPNTEAYITPSMEEVDKLVQINCDIIAIDCTKNSRIVNLSAEEYIKLIKKKYPNQLLMADISNLDEAISAYKSGIDFIGTTLNGYVKGSIIKDEPDYDLVKKIHEACPIPVIAEGRIHYPYQAKKMFEVGAYSVVVGGAITRPQEITKRFVDAINNK